METQGGAGGKSDFLRQAAGGQLGGKCFSITINTTPEKLIIKKALVRVVDKTSVPGTHPTHPRETRSPHLGALGWQTRL